jgi:ABC-type nitrate/sulfonate/bicarbonate transport system substrate-binding protein
MSKDITAERVGDMSAADQYRRNASECVAITAFFVDSQQRAAVLALAEAWNRLAEQADKNAQAVLSATADAPPRSSGDADRRRDGRPPTEGLRGF